MIISTCLLVTLSFISLGNLADSMRIMGPSNFENRFLMPMKSSDDPATRCDCSKFNYYEASRLVNSIGQDKECEAYCSSRYRVQEHLPEKVHHDSQEKSKTAEKSEESDSDNSGPPVNILAAINKEEDALHYGIHLNVPIHLNLFTLLKSIKIKKENNFEDQNDGNDKEQSVNLRQHQRPEKSKFRVQTEAPARQLEEFPRRNEMINSIPDSSNQMLPHRFLRVPLMAIVRKPNIEREEASQQQPRGMGGPWLH